jgi:hypothetical protein
MARFSLLAGAKAAEDKTGQGQDVGFQAEPPIPAELAVFWSALQALKPARAPMALSLVQPTLAAGVPVDVFCAPARVSLIAA